MKKLLAPVLVAGLLAVGAPAAHAANAEYRGGCGFAAIEDPTPDGNLGGQGVYTGEVDWQIVLFDEEDAGDNPVSGTVSCEVQVNGVVHDSTIPEDVTVAGAGADVLTYTKSAVTDVVEMCTVITNWSDGSPNTRDCGPATSFQIPPQEVLDLIDFIFDTIAEVTEPTDETVCDVLQLAGIPALTQSTYATTGVWVDSDDCDIWLNGPVWELIFITPARVIDFSPYEDPYTGP